MKVFGKTVKSYNAALKVKAIKHMLNNESPAKLSQKLKIPVGTLYTWVAKARKNGTAVPQNSVVPQKHESKVSHLIEAEIATLQNKIKTLKTLKGILDV